MKVGDLVRVHWGTCDWSGEKGIDWGHSSGMIAGEALMGVIVAVFIMADIPANGWFGFLKQLGPMLSLAFFLWFVIVFTWLATRGMPESKHGRGNLITDWIAVAFDGVRRFVSSIKPPTSGR